MKVGIIDYGVGNLGSVARALQEQNVVPVLIDRATDISTVDRLILPGVGNFSDCADRLNRGGWVSALHDEVLGRSRPLFGICVGMQLLADIGTEGVAGSELSGVSGLGFVPGTVQHLRVLGCSLRVPHVGWNTVIFRNDAGGLFDGIPNRTDFYFVHSYAFCARDAVDVVAVTEHGIIMTVAVRRKHIWGAQFHPEKSSRAGYRVLQNFIAARLC